MLTDGYGLPLSTTSFAARDAYVEACEAKLTMYPGAIEAFDRAIAADPDFALAHAAKAHLLLERGDAAAARASMAAATSIVAGLSAREASHVAIFELLVAGEAEGALSALLAHVGAWPRDAVVLATTAFTNGLIGSSGRAGQKRTLLELLERLAPSYGGDWWFTAHHGMALSENGQREAARPKGADDVGAELTCELRDHRPDCAGCAVHEDALPRLKAAVLEQSLPRSQARDRHNRRLSICGFETGSRSPASLSQIRARTPNSATRPSPNGAIGRSRHGNYAARLRLHMGM